MYSLSQLRRAFSTPRLILREVNRLYHTRFRQWEYNQRGINFFEEDWDNLLILDACRYDAFERKMRDRNFPGHLESRFSQGSATPEFLKSNIDGLDLTDTVYVTGTTMVYREQILNGDLDVKFHAVDDVWGDSIEYGEWGVLPKTMAARTREAVETYPNKRIVTHFIQPHIPFIGPTGEKYESELGTSPWKSKVRGELDLSDDILWQAYMENLDLVLDEVTELIYELPGKTVITADHGQLIGDRGFPIPIKDYGHPTALYYDELVKVPWHVSQNGDRKRVTKGNEATVYSEESTSELDEKAKKHLEQLGYL